MEFNFEDYEKQTETAVSARRIVYEVEAKIKELLVDKQRALAVAQHAENRAMHIRNQLSRM